MSDPVYIPNLKTSDSELRALRYLASSVKDKILPVFELTRSRITTKNPNGSVIRRAEQVTEIYGDGDFILDVTTESDLMNPQMGAFFDEANGYANWRSFLSSMFPSKIYPCVQYVEGGTEVEFKRQVEELSSRYEKVVLRTSVFDLEVNQLYLWMLDVTDSRRVIVVGNVFFLEQQANAVYVDRCRGFLSEVIGNRLPDAVAFPGSSFPKSVAIGVYGKDDSGKFSAVELDLYETLTREFPNMPLVYSDYASVHPIRYPTRGGGWVPRIDVFQSGEFVYSRLRNDDGGYAAAAKVIMRNYGNSLPACWGTEQIRQAATGNVPGRSPSFWISARINMWITQRANDLSEGG
jgi:hypothetical protein